MVPSKRLSPLQNYPVIVNYWKNKPAKIQTAEKVKTPPDWSSIRLQSADLSARHIDVSTNMRHMERSVVWNWPLPESMRSLTIILCNVIRKHDLHDELHDFYFQNGSWHPKSHTWCFNTAFGKKVYLIILPLINFCFYF